MNRVYNFGAGPGALPLAVLEQARDELLNWHGLGMSIMEIGHRSSQFVELTQQIEQDFRDLLNIPKNYKTLFLQGGARTQFAMVPLNLLRGKNTADYINTGVWSDLAIKEAKKYCQVNIAASDQNNHYKTIPETSEWHANSDAAYLHYVDNETVNGVEFSFIPKTGNVPLVADMSSNILSRPFDVTQYGVIYAGAQKNVGPAGLTLAIVREDLMGAALPITPTMLNYKTHADNDSLYNTPPVFAWYMAGLVFKWVKEQGGVAHMAKINAHKAAKLYQFIDDSEFYFNEVDIRYRSRMNVIFNLIQPELEDKFLQQAKTAGLVGLKGHKLVGGLRASLYNAVTEQAVDALINFMAEFAKQHVHA